MLKKMDIKTVVIGGGPVTSLLVLKTADGREGEATSLPIRIGSVEATAISMGIEPGEGSRPMTHDLLMTVVEELGGHLRGVIISGVEGTTFYAMLDVVDSSGDSRLIDCRPSDAVAAAVRAGVPIFAESDVLDVAGMPDFQAIEEEERNQELRDFHDFVEGLSPDDFKDLADCDDAGQSGPASDERNA